MGDGTERQDRENLLGALQAALTSHQPVVDKAWAEVDIAEKRAQQAVTARRDALAAARRCSGTYARGLQVMCCLIS